MNLLVRYLTVNADFPTCFAPIMMSRTNTSLKVGTAPTVFEPVVLPTCSTLGALMVFKNLWLSNWGADVLWVEFERPFWGCREDVLGSEVTVELFSECFLATLGECSNELDLDGLLTLKVWARWAEQVPCFRVAPLPFDVAFEGFELDTEDGGWFGRDEGEAANLWGGRYFTSMLVAQFHTSYAWRTCEHVRLSKDGCVSKDCQIRTKSVTECFSFTCSSWITLEHSCG